MNISQFDYYLPPELIAQTPIEPRHASRLMVIDSRSGEITHHTFAGLVDLLRRGDILVANDSRVLPARLFGRKQSGGKVEILLLKRVDALRWEALADVSGNYVAFVHLRDTPESVGLPQVAGTQIAGANPEAASDAQDFRRFLFERVFRHIK
jgi:S-adenosylmethionine:tRNA-ribosyltransferase-isomerase (queuine synthetase)